MINAISAQLSGVIVQAYLFEEINQIKIKQVVINLKNSVIKSQVEHIDIIEQAIKSVADYLMIDKNIIRVVYE